MPRSWKATTLAYLDMARQKLKKNSSYTKEEEVTNL